MLNCHLDSVQPKGLWQVPPYGAVREGKKIYGLGAADMKGGCAAAIMTMVALQRRKPTINGELFLSCVFGEESPFSLGTDTLLREFDLKDYDLIIVTEPSPLLAINDYCMTHKRTHRSRFPVVIVGAEGRILFEIEFTGRATHASHPSQGVNALHDAARVISELARFDLYSNIKMGRGHYCVLNIDGGDASFTVPGYCKVLVNRQLTLGETDGSTLRELKKIIRESKLKSRIRIQKRFSPSPELEYRPYIFEDGGYIDSFIESLDSFIGSQETIEGKRSGGKKKSCCKFTTSSVGDFNLFGTRSRVPTVVFGPGGGNIHAPNEFVNTDEIINSANIILSFLMKVL